MRVVVLASVTQTPNKEPTRCDGRRLQGVFFCNHYGYERIMVLNKSRKDPNRNFPIFWWYEWCRWRRDNGINSIQLACDVLCIYSRSFISLFHENPSIYASRWLLETLLFPYWFTVEQEHKNIRRQKNGYYNVIGCSDSMWTTSLERMGGMWCKDGLWILISLFPHNIRTTKMQLPQALQWCRVI